MEAREARAGPAEPWDWGSVLPWFSIFLGNYPVKGWPRGLEEECELEEVDRKGKRDMKRER